ncbi:hypothetical protein QBC46DRAFT_70259 [Diplogelasinospora grovesii]|uniref:Uncharacterized protein n=1 Tax=Diplogelasinospora grovesii TaxID=303347 RepID=A0AAN6MZJ5_9PEZI|nr:hypothetical protein QBC46DRAFT_70259 [Diplogelasinospora grovesii]
MSTLHSAQEMRRRWSDRANGVLELDNRDHRDYCEYPPANHDQDMYFRQCRKIVFMAEGDLLLMTQGNGHMSVPPGVKVFVTDGMSRCERSASGSMVGARAPPPTRAASYAGSSYMGQHSQAGSRAPTQSTHRPVGGYSNSPSSPQSRAPYSRAVSYVSARDIRLPASHAGSKWDDDADSIAPSESISSVGSRGRSSYSHY